MAKKERELPEKLEIPFAIADETVNRNGWRLKVDSIRTASFEKNPVCVVQHDQWMVPVGRWTSLTKEKGVLKGTLEFDRNDEHAVMLYWKYKDGYMNAVSLHVFPLVESDDKKDLLPGQRYKTVMESDLLEISLVTVPAYGNSVKLCYADGKEYKASLIDNSLNINRMEKDEKTVEQLQAELNAQRLLNAENLIKYHKFRGVVTDGEVEPLKKLAQSDYASVSNMLEARTPAPVPAGKPDSDPKAELADGLVKLHAERGAITEAEKPVFKAAAMADYEGTKKLLEAKPGTSQAKDFVAGMSGGSQSQSGNERDKWTYLDWYKKDLAGLQAMAKSDAERHKKLVADFEASCKQQGLMPDGNE